MKKTIPIVLVITVLIVILSALCACGKEEDEGNFIPASDEEYVILDEGDKSVSGSVKHSGSGNTNAKKSDGKNKQTDSDSVTSEKGDDSSKTATTETPVKEPENFSEDEYETPFVPVK